MPCVDLTTSSLMTPLMALNVLSIGPPAGGVADEDGGLKAGVAPSNKERKTGNFSGQSSISEDIRGRCRDKADVQYIIMRADPKASKLLPLP